MRSWVREVVEMGETNELRSYVKGKIGRTPGTYTRAHGETSH